MSVRAAIVHSSIVRLFQLGDQAWDARDYFIEQERCYDVQLESTTFCGKFYPECEKEKEKRERKEKANREKTKKKQDEKKKKKEKEAKEEL